MAAELSAAEQLALLAVRNLHPNGYGVTVRVEIHRCGGGEPSLGSIYAVTDRLAAKGYLRVRLGEPTAERGGRRKMHLEITAAGRTALDRSLDVLDRLRVGFGDAGVPA